MHISRGLILSLILIIAGAAAYWKFQDQLVSLSSWGAPAAQVARPPEQPNGLTEEQWTLMEVCDQILFLLHPELINQPTTGNRITAVRNRTEPASYTVAAGKAKSAVTLGTSVWDPVTYQTWCKAVSSEAATSNALPRQEIVSQLLTPDTTTFLALEASLTQELAKHPRDPAVYTDAALLLGTMGWFDAAGHFQDVRPLLNRMTAFLAVADALGAQGKNREIVEILRLVLVHDQAGALAKISAARRATSQIPQPWLDALEVTATEDWRKTEPTAAAEPMLLQLAHFRVLTRNMSAHKAEGFLKTLPKAEGTIWVRYLTQTVLGIGQGHMYSRALLAMETAETNAVAKACGRSSVLQPQESYLSFVKEFNGLSSYERPPESAVVGVQLWAGRTQRHLLQAMAVMHDFLQNRWGVPEQATEFNAAMRKQFVGLYYFPFLTLQTAEPRSRPAIEAQTAAEKITREQPASVAPKLWATLKPETPEGIARHTPDFHPFYNPEVPRHTSFEAGKRIYEIGVGDENSLPLLKSLLARCPYDYEMAFQTALVEGRPDNVESKRLECCMQFADLFQKASAWVVEAARNNPQKFERLKVREAEGNPDAYIHLASYFNTRKDLARAEKYLLLAQGKVDKVYFANACGFLVRFYAENGRMKEAEAMAKDAGEAYSRTGLGTLGWLQEYRQQWDEAAKTYRAIDERYGTVSRSDFLAYVIRRKLAGPGWRTEYQAAIDKLFPRGLEKVSLDSLGSAPPRSGASFAERSKKLQKAGLGLSDVVVGVDGIRVENKEQYASARDLSDSPEMILLVWDGQGYSEITLSQPGRRSNVELRTYRP